VDGECQKFEVLVPNQFAPENIALAPDYAFLAARDAANMLHVLRVSRWTGQIDTLAAVAPWFRIRASAVGSMRVYLSDEDVLKSFALDGTDPRDENLTVETIAAHGGFLYYSSLGALYRWSETDRTPTLVREFGATQSIELAGCTAGVFAAVNYPAATDPERYELYFLTPTVEPTLFHAGTGVAGRLVAAYGDAYFLVRQAERVELRHVPGDPDVLDADATSLVELAAVSGGVLATFLSATSEGLRFYAQSDAHIRFEWATRGDLLRFTSTFDGELWFVDSSPASLARSKRPEL